MKAGCGRQRRSRVAIQQILPHRNRRPQAGHLPHLGRREPQACAPDRENLQKTTPRLVIQGVEDQRGLSRSRDAGDDRQTVTEIYVDVLEIVGASAADVDRQWSPSPFEAVSGRRCWTELRGKSLAVPAKGFADNACGSYASFRERRNVQGCFPPLERAEDRTLSLRLRSSAIWR